ncbi:MAG: virulence RhuM family protein, partial [Prevotellaceae bacterium]|nr:virulence RhuM family protein [Prevotellaceae bacterium]
VRKQDIYISKNYLTEDEIDRLNRFVTVFLETAELRAKERKDITMAFWKENVDKILLLNDKQILSGKGSISNAQMEEFVDNVYLQFDTGRKKQNALLADEQDITEIKELENEVKHLKTI